MKFDRRDFIKLSALGGASLAGGAFLQACGSSENQGTDAASGDWWTSGNYAPVMEESDITQFEIEGEIPAGIDGMFLRNGPNPPSGKSANWFFGDAMLHGFRIEAGKMSWYKNRYIRTEAYLSGATSAPTPAITANLSNTALVLHAGKLLSLYEGGRPYQVRPNDLSTVGEHDFGGRLRTAISAHPKVDPENGEMHLVGYSPAAPFLTHHVVDKNGILLRSRPIDLPRAVMIHDFQLTKNFVIILDMPVVFDLNLLTSGGFPFAWRPEHGARIGVFSRNDDTQPIRWFEIASSYIFHTVNAYEDEAGRIILDASRHDQIWAKGPLDVSDVHPLWQYQIDLASGRVTETQVDDANYEFPITDPARAGRPSRYGYGLEFKNSEPGGRKAPTGMIKYDLKNRTRAGILELGDIQPDEVSFVPDARAANEDDGYLVGIGANPKGGNGMLLIADAREMRLLAKVKIPKRIPFGFHGTWLPGEAFSG